jgi:hypothetical protein
MPDSSPRAKRGGAWGVLAVIIGTFAAAAWYSAPQQGLGNWLAWVLSVLTAAALYPTFADAVGVWPVRRRPALDLVPEIAGNRVLIGVVCHGRGVDCSAEVIKIRRPPSGRPKGRQNWPIPWDDNHTVEPKRILTGQTRVLDFAVFSPAAVKATISTGLTSADHWRFISVPRPIGINYYNLIRLSDVDEQEFVLTIRILIAQPERYLDWQLTVKAKNSEIVCECLPVRCARHKSPRRSVSTGRSWSTGSYGTSS